MHISRLLTFSALAVGLSTLSACSEIPTAHSKNQVSIRSLAVSGVRVNATAFRANGSFDLGLIGTTDDNSVILDPTVGVDIALTAISSGAPANFSVSKQRTVVVGSNSADTRALIILDNSGSMAGNDPTTLRATAAQLFWTSVLGARPGNQVALSDFGVGSTAPFSDTRLLQGFTTDPSLLAAQLPQIRASGSTPLYESLQESATWMAANTAASANRVILLLSDGQPNSSARKADAIAAVKSGNITVHTVGLGPASDLSTQPSAGAVAAVRDLADETGGVYAAATTADALQPIFTALARATSRGQLISTFQMSPVPASGVRISGTVTVTSGGRSGTASWSFIAP